MLALAVWLVARLVTGVVTAVVARDQVANLWTGADPGYLDFVGIWDGRWYARIAESGYPHPLPVDALDRPEQSPWAFFPAYPGLVRLVMASTGLDWRVAAPVTSLAAGCLAAVVTYRLFRLRAEPPVALAGVAVLAVFPSAAVLQYAFADVVSVLALVGALHLLVTRRYLLGLLPVALLGLSRPVGLPFTLVVGVHLLVRWRGRHTDDFPTRERVAVLVLGVVAVASSLAFPAAVALAAGRVDGYAAVQQAWRSGEGMRWFTPWWDIARFYLGERGGALVLVLLVTGMLALLASRAVRRRGPEMWTWCAAYALYLAAVLEPYTSIVRHLLLFVPLALVVASWLVGEDDDARPHGRGSGRGPWGRGRWRRWAPLAAWLIASMALQVLWIDVLWRFDPPTDLPP